MTDNLINHKIDKTTIFKILSKIDFKLQETL